MHMFSTAKWQIQQPKKDAFELQYYEHLGCNLPHCTQA